MPERDDDRRPSPEAFLRLAREEEAAQGRGRLKLFFGMCPGVGKTYAMLEAARQRAAEGLEVVVGLVETHGRRETEVLLEGLETLPRRRVVHQGVELGEFDLDAALARNPRLILVDELAHTNAPGSRHVKRWQDVSELLDAGIDVSTTLNVQHWESLNDVVARITGRVVRETVPDTFLRRADEIELVDLSPEDLLRRLREGKVYRGDMAERAADSFFRIGNLIALRELALRHVAERVDAQMQRFRERHEIPGVWDVGERLLVGVSSGPMSARLVRATARLAARLRATWIAAYVETPGELRLPAADRARVSENLRLAEQLGAETVTRSGQRVTEELLLLAKERNVTKVVLGKPARPRWKEWLHGSVVNEMARHSGDVDLYVISGTGTGSEVRRPPGAGRPVPPREGIAWGIAAVVVSTLLCKPLFPLVDSANLIMIYLVGVAWTAYRHGRAASLVAATLSVLAFDFFYVPPHLTFAVSDTQYLLTFGAMLGVGILISTLADRLHRQNEQMRRREERLRALYGLSLELSETPEPQRILESARQRLEEFYRTPVVMITRAGDATLAIAAGTAESFPFDESERAVAQWVLDHGQIAGAGTDTLRAARGLYAPLRGTQSTVGVLGILPRAGLDLSDPEQIRLLETFAGGIGGALESTRMTAAAGRAELMLELQALQTPLGGSPLRLGDCLAESNILRIRSGTPPEEVFRDLIATLRLHNPSQALQMVLEREKSGGTAIGSGVSVPHARLPGLTTIRAALGLSPVGPARVWALFLGPQERPELVLEFLAGLAAFFRCEENVRTLLASETPAQALAFIRSCACREGERGKTA
jgi:two-component system sensor histidine kinase KdpD